MTKEIVSKLRQIHTGLADHARGCEGRNYSCDCGYDTEVQELCGYAADTLSRLTRELAEARENVARLEKQSERDDKAMDQVITERDAAEDAMQWLDCELGGNGEYYFNTAEPNNCPCDPPSMARMIAERVTAEREELSRLAEAERDKARAELAECRDIMAKAYAIMEAASSDWLAARKDPRECLRAMQPAESMLYDFRNRALKTEA